MARGIARHGVHTERPADHVGKERHQKRHAHDDGERMRGTEHGARGIDDARIKRQVLGGNGRPDADAAEDVDGGDGDAARDHGFGDVVRRVLHGAREGRHDLEPHKVEEDDREIGERINVSEVGQEGAHRHVVRKAVRAGEPDARRTHHERDEHLDERAAVHDPVGLGHRVRGHDRHTPHKAELDAEFGGKRELNAPERIDDAREHAGEARHPERKVHPIAPRAAGAPFVAQTLAHPVVKTALGVEGYSELGHHEAVREQKRDDEKDPPEELLVAHGRCRGRGLDSKDHADDG